MYMYMYVYIFIFYMQLESSFLSDECNGVKLANVMSEVFEKLNSRGLCTVSIGEPYKLGSRHHIGRDCAGSHGRRKARQEQLNHQMRIPITEGHNVCACI